MITRNHFVGIVVVDVGGAYAPISEEKSIIQWVLDYPNSDYLYPNNWTSAHISMFSAAAGKRRCSHCNFATGENTAAV